MTLKYQFLSQVFKQPYAMTKQICKVVGLLFSVETIFHCLSCLVFTCSCIWIKVCFQNTNILVDTYYCPPGQLAGRRDTFLDGLSFFISKTIEANISAIIITGEETLITGALHGFLIISPVTLASFCVSWWKEMVFPNR